MTTLLWQPPLAPRYREMDDAQLQAAIAQRKQQLGSDLVVLGHHYQQDPVIAFADFTGDSFKLSQLAAERVREAGAKYVIFAGVHFMAETADILTDEDVTVILPDLGAGCSMADMANIDQVQEAWQLIAEMTAGQNVRVIPICYMNSTAAIKAFCGDHGGAVCTSSNAQKIIDWALRGGDEPLQDGQTVKILFTPDQHLGRNTGAALGYDVNDDMVLWDPVNPDTVDEAAVRRSTFILWKGHCSVHKLFRAEHVDDIRRKWPDVTVMVHPECAYEVCQKADRTGSTEGIIQAIQTAEPGSRWAIGTEVHLVNRLAREAADRDVTVRILSDCQCLCTTMYRIDLPHLLHAMDEIAAGRTPNAIRVEPHVRDSAIVALNRMLRITGNATLEA
jgi:quinolinate synthase